jgi:tryptophan 7-halogenase
VAQEDITSVVIVGGGTAGWMSAAFMSSMLGPNIHITLVDLGEGNEACLDEASLPPLKALHYSLGISEADFLAKTQGSMKLGTQFVNWGNLGDRYFHPHGAYGAEFDAVPLHQWWLKSRASGPETFDLSALSLAATMAKDSRFTPPSPDRRLIQSTFDFAYHFDRALYQSYLSAYAQQRGVEVLSSDVSQVHLHTETGYVTGLSLTDGRTLSGDLFVDCTGQRGFLIKETLGTSFVDWSEHLPCDRAIAVSCASGTDFSSCSRVIAREAGWQSRIPLQHRTSMMSVFSSLARSDDDILSGLMDNLDGKALGGPVTYSFNNGRSDKAFVKNVVAIGGAAGFLEPLEAINLQLIQSALTRLFALWPSKQCEPLVSDEYNQITAREWDLARDFLVLHYKLTNRTDTPFWRACRELSLPDSLQARLAHWDAFGRLISPGPEVFQGSAWLSVLIGQGRIPQAWDPLADARAIQVDYQARLAGLQRIIAETTSQMPLHRDWIAKYAKGPRVA